MGIITALTREIEASYGENVVTVRVLTPHRISKITGKRCRHRKSSKGTACFWCFFGPWRCCCKSPAVSVEIWVFFVFLGKMDGVEEPFTRMWPFRFKERKQFVIWNALDTRGDLSTGVLHFFPGVFVSRVKPPKNQPGNRFFGMNSSACFGGRSWYFILLFSIFRRSTLFLNDFGPCSKKPVSKAFFETWEGEKSWIWTWTTVDGCNPAKPVLDSSVSILYIGGFQPSVVKIKWHSNMFQHAQSQM